MVRMLACEQSSWCCDWSMHSIYRYVFRASKSELFNDMTPLCLETLTKSAIASQNGRTRRARPCNSRDHWEHAAAAAAAAGGRGGPD